MGLRVSLFPLYNLVCVSFSSLLEEPGHHADEDTPFSGNMQTPRGSPGRQAPELPGAQALARDSSQTGEGPGLPLRLWGSG